MGESRSSLTKKGKETAMNHYITRDTQLPGYLVFPRALLQTELTAAEAAVYMLLLDRARLSMQKEKWTDGEGRAFLYFPILELARAIGRSDTAVKNALRGLEQKDLISRKRQGMGKPSRIFVKLPESGKPASPIESKEASPAESKEASPIESKEASPAESKEASSMESKPASPTEGKPGSPMESKEASPAYRKEASSAWARRLPPNKNYRDKTKELSLPKRPAGPTAEEYQRMLRFLNSLGETGGQGPQAPLTPRPPGPSPERPPSCP